MGLCLNNVTLHTLWTTATLPNSGFDRWIEYAEHYEAHLPRPSAVAPKMRMLEIGVQSGGSAQLWSKCYGETIYYTGVDIDPACKRSHAPDQGVHIEIGSAMNSTFLLDICKRHGPFDVVIDDGGHTARMINSAISVLFSNDACMAPRSVYVVEDLHVMRLCETDHSYCSEPSEISGMPSLAFQSMHDYHFKSKNGGRSPPATIFTGRIAAIYLYDSIAFYVRASPQPKIHRIKRGRSFFTNKEATLNDLGAYARKNSSA